MVFAALPGLAGGAHSPAGWKTEAAVSCGLPAVVRLGWLADRAVACPQEGRRRARSVYRVTSRRPRWRHEGAGSRPRPGWDQTFR
jgi:hypothetical protein